MSEEEAPKPLARPRYESDSPLEASPAIADEIVADVLLPLVLPVLPVGSRCLDRLPRSWAFAGFRLANR